jgi:RNA polymerase sigma factor (sigma-70 family)
LEKIVNLFRSGALVPITVKSAQLRGHRRGKLSASVALLRYVRPNLSNSRRRLAPELPYRRALGGIKSLRRRLSIRRIPGRRTQAIEGQRLTQFDQVVLPHLGAAYNLARWLTHNDHDADDVVQEAYLRAYRFFDSFHGSDGRAWLLRIVRNTCYTWLEKNRSHEPTTTFDETQHSGGATVAGPDAALLASEDRKLLWQALAELPEEFREAIVLRELEGMSYREIAAVIGAPIGTVMSRLARARERLQESLTRRLPEES